MRLLSNRCRSQCNRIRLKVVRKMPILTCTVDSEYSDGGMNSYLAIKSRTAPGGISAASSSQVIGLSGGPHSAGQAPAEPVVPVVVVVGSPVYATVVEHMSQPVQSHSLESCSHDACWVRIVRSEHGDSVGKFITNIKLVRRQAASELQARRRSLGCQVVRTLQGKRQPILWCQSWWPVLSWSWGRQCMRLLSNICRNRCSRTHWRVARMMPKQRVGNFNAYQRCSTTASSNFTHGARWHLSCKFIARHWVVRGTTIRWATPSCLHRHQMQ